MIKLFARLFIKNHKEYTVPKVREQYGILCSAFGIFLNVLLFVAKLTGAAITHSVAVLADALNNLSDAASSVVSVIGFKLSGKKPDADHPFGHGRLEYISGLIVSFLILLMGIELFKSSIGAIRSPAKTEGGTFSIAILSASILVKCYMYIYNHGIAKKIKSAAMDAVAKDSFGDMISTSVVILSIIAGHFTALPVDGIGGLIVAVFILKGGIESCKETIDPLLGLPPEKEFVSKIEKEVLKFSPIIGIHDLVIHDYGPGRMMISLHAEVPGDKNLFDLHEVIDRAEHDLSKKFNCNVVIHMDPIDVNNTRLKELKQILIEETKKIGEGFSVHDVRMVPGKLKSNLIFDIVRPYDCTLSEDEICRTIRAAIKSRASDVNCVMTVETPYVQ